MTNTKKCLRCGQELTIETNFNRDSWQKDGYDKYCRACRKIYRHKTYMKNREKEIAVQSVYDKVYANRKECQALARKYKAECPSGCEFHHWNYFEPTSVIILDKRTHNRIHRLLKFDDIEQMFIVEKTGELLDTLDKHLAFINRYVYEMRDSHIVGLIDFSRC